VELLVVLVVLSILAAVALPYAETTVRRERELALRRALRDIRSALDRVHADWEAERISRAAGQLSADGWPRTLDALVQGVDTGDAARTRRWYLRRIPRDPFADPQVPPAQQWALRGYRDAPDAASWGGEDVYDVHSRSDRTALDGTRYADW
jgi:general secretion pathway protein G